MHTCAGLNNRYNLSAHLSDDRGIIAVVIAWGARFDIRAKCDGRDMAHERNVSKN
jgi:hypothetical protein